jgi:ribosomal protein S18 acetylase RimI-like enzyme
MKINEISGQIQYRVYPPSAFSGATLDRLVELITSGGESNNRSLITKLRKAHAIAFARVDGLPIGVAVIKRPVASYPVKVFTAAGVPELAENFQIELGYVMINPQYRGQGVGSKLLSLFGNHQAPIYSTVRKDNAAMISLLQTAGFTQVGTPYKGESGAELTLWIKQ